MSAHPLGQLTAPNGVQIWRHYVPSRYGQTHVLSARPANARAATQRPLVCLHQSPMSGDVWLDFLPHMATDRIVHCPDTPGFGASDGPPPSDIKGKPDIRDLGLGMVDTLESLGFSGSEPADVCGFHTGSMVATELTLARPELVNRMVLCGFPYYEADMRMKMEERFVTPYAFLTDPDYAPDMYDRMVLNGASDLTPEERLAAFTDRMRAGPRGQEGPDAVWRYDADAGLSALAALDKPTLWITFNEVLTEPAKEARRRFFPDSALAQLEHLPMVGFKHGPEDVAAALRQFLDG
jgi:pimeloyl-ACP methyl ester carboxylesterase